MAGPANETGAMSTGHTHQHIEGDKERTHESIEERCKNRHINMYIFTSSFIRERVQMNPHITRERANQSTLSTAKYLTRQPCLK